MLPQFPQFKTLDIDDKESLEAVTNRYLPYSDFNFVSMWSWDVLGEMKVSQLNNNLVVQFTDYLTEQPIFSFLGDTKIQETAQILLDFSKKEGVSNHLKFIPEETARKLDVNFFTIEEDVDHFDYIYDLEELKLLRGVKFETKRGAINRFLKNNKNISSGFIDISNTQTKNDIIKLNHDWIEGKKKKDPFFDIKNELLAIGRFLEMSQSLKHYCVGIFNNDILVGYSINEVVSQKYAIGHFYKTNNDGCFEYLMRETGFHLSNVNLKYLNFEQDLGVEGLRHSKTSYRPIMFLKKYKVFSNNK